MITPQSDKAKSRFSDMLYEIENCQKTDIISHRKLIAKLLPCGTKINESSHKKLTIQRLKEFRKCILVTGETIAELRGEGRY